MKYPKIYTLFNRDDNNIIIPDQFSLPEFEYLKDCQWEATEKIDGINIRIELESTYNGIIRSFKGKTEDADIPDKLLNRLHELFPKEKLMEVFHLNEEDVCSITLFGEGYGNKIRKGGKNYISDGVDFILFDININGWWLERRSVEEIATMLGIKVVPLVGYMTIPEAIQYVYDGFNSLVAENKDYKAEGLVLKPKHGLLLRNKERIITKLEAKDFIRFNYKYFNSIPKITQNETIHTKRIY